MFSLKSKTNDVYLNTETMLSYHVFDTYIGSVLDYGCEIWGFHNGIYVEKNTGNHGNRLTFMFSYSIFRNFESLGI